MKHTNEQRKAKPKTSKTKHEQEVEYIPYPPGFNFPFSQAVRVGQTLYISGHLGLIPGTTTLVEGGVIAQTKQAMDDLGMLLDSQGSSFDQVIQSTVLLANINDWGAVNDVYVTYFPKDRLPARTAFATRGLPLGAQVEIECMAMIKHKRRK